MYTAARALHEFSSFRQQLLLYESFISKLLSCRIRVRSACGLVPQVYRIKKINIASCPYTVDENDIYEFFYTFFDHFERFSLR